MYKRYSDPRGLLSLYIDSGRFGELVENLLTAEIARRKEEAEKENERKMWELYLHTNTDKSFKDWRDEIMRNHKAQAKAGAQTGKRDEDMTNEDVNSLLSKLFPSRVKPEAPT